MRTPTSNMHKLKKLFEPSPGRGLVEGHHQPSKPNLSRNQRPNPEIFVDQERYIQSEARKSRIQGLDMTKDWRDWTRMGRGGPIERTDETACDGIAKK